MSLVDFIIKLQKQPKYIRTQIKWVGVTIFMVILFSFWLWSLGTAVSGQAKNKPSDKGLESLDQLKNDLPTLWQSLGAGIGNIWGSIEQDLSNQSIDSGQESVSSSPSSSPSLDRLPIE